jgi:outer membrane protein assembly factor BamD (BamD/ComL family)
MYALGPLGDSLVSSDAQELPDSAAAAVREVYGPPADSLQLILNARAVELLPDELWEEIVDGDSLYGPPSPASIYDFGVGEVLGPATPTELLFVRIEEPEVDSTAILEREARAALRKERESAFAEIETAAETQMQLAELYRFDLDYPDSALVEYKEIAERYKGTPYGAQALLATADIYVDEFDDSASAHEYLTRILWEYPYSDYAGDAIVRLRWSGTSADTAHPAVAYAAAEDRYLIDNDARGAIRRFREFIEKYPYSRLVPRAEFAIAVLTDRYFPSNDSAVVWAYQEIAATYAQTDFAVAATERLSDKVTRPKPRSAPTAKETPLLVQNRPGQNDDTTASESARLPRAPKPRVYGQVQFPSSDRGVITKEVVVVYKILIDYSGNVDQYELIQKSPSPELDEATRIAIQETKFNPDSIPLESLMIWYKYEMHVTPPALDPNEIDVYRRTGGIPNIQDPNQQPVTPP